MPLVPPSLRTGSFLVLLSAAGYALLPILVKWAYAAGLEPLDVVTWRFIFAAPLVWVLVLLRRRTGGSELPRVRLLAMGGLFALVSATAFMALARIPSSLYTVLLYTYPAIVTLMARVGGEQIARRGWLALGLTLLGIVLTVPRLGEVARGGVDPLGVGLALVNATLYTLFIIGSNRLLRGQTALAEASAWTISGALLGHTLAALARGLPAPTTAAGWASIVGLAAFCTVLPIFTFLAGMQRLGAARASLLSTVEPLLTLLLARLLLGEMLTGQQAMGAALVLAGVLLAQRRRE